MKSSTILGCIAPLLYLSCAWADDIQKPPEANASDVSSVAENSSRAIGRDKIFEEFLSDEQIQGTLNRIEAYIDARPPSAPGVEPDSADKLTVRQCVEMALKQNPQVDVAADDVEAAQARIGQARAKMLPQVSVGSAYVWNNRVNAQGIFGGLGQQQETISETLTLSQTLYAGGQIRAAIQASEFLANSEEWKREAKLQDIEFQTKQAYYDSMLARALVRVSEESILTFERNLADAQHMFEVGMISNFEVLRAKTELGSRQAEQVAANNAHELALANLRRVIGLPQNAAVSLEPRLEWLPNELPKEHYIELAAINRPEVQALGKGIEAARVNIQRIKGEYLPQVGANAEYLASDNESRIQRNGWVVSLGVKLDLVAGGRRKYERKEAEAQRMSLEHQLKDLHQLIDLNVTQAYAQIQDSMAEIRRTRGTVDLAREGLRLAELRFQQGVGTQSETLDAELALTNAETALVQAIRNYAVANAALERSVGVSWVRPSALDEKDNGAVKK